MSRRVFINADNFIVGPAGADCISVPESDLIFSNRGGSYNGIFMLGSVGANAFSESQEEAGRPGNSATRYIREATVLFGKSFPTAPRAFIGAMDRTESQPAFTPMVYYSTLAAGSGGVATGEVLTLSAGVGTDRIVLRVVYLRYSGSRFNRYLDCAYAIFDR